MMTITEHGRLTVYSHQFPNGLRIAIKVDSLALGRALAYSDAAPSPEVIDLERADIMELARSRAGSPLWRTVPDSMINRFIDTVCFDLGKRLGRPLAILEANPKTGAPEAVCYAPDGLRTREELDPAIYDLLTDQEVSLISVPAP